MMDSISVPGSALHVPAFLSPPGGMSERIHQYKWAGTPLGALAEWKHSLRSTVSICLNSNFPIAVYWGPDLILLYNDAWSTIPGNKHPWALGRPAKEVWPDIWDEISPQFQKAFSGEPGGSKDAMLPMMRHGYTEECYFDFTFTPLYSEEGNVEGIFNPVIETTFRIIHERRSRFLHKLSQKISTVPTVEEVFKKVNTLIKQHPEDIPFCNIYTLGEGPDPVLSLSTVPASKVKNLPFEDLMKSGSTIPIRSVGLFMDSVPAIHWPEQIAEGLLVPLKANNGKITGFIFAGLSARRKCDQDYQLFVEGFSNVIGTSLNTIQSLDEERNRAEVMNAAKVSLEKSEAALRLANEQLELTFRNVPAAIYLFNKEGRIIFTNNQAGLRAGALSGIENMEGKSLQWIHQRINDLFDMRNESGESFSMENSPEMITFNSGKAAQEIIQFINKKNGDEQWILSTAAPLLSASGELSMVLACSTDISLQKQAEKEIRKSEEKFRNLSQALPQLVWVTDAKGKQVYATNRWNEFTGVDPYDLRTWSIIVHPDDSRRLADTWSSCLERGNTYKAEARLKSKLGNYRWFHVQGEPIRNEKNEITQWVGAFTDIHEQKMAEDLLRQSEGQLEFLVKKRTMELERSNEDLQQFAHVASHDLKEPIRKIKIFSGLLEDEISGGMNENAKLYLSKVQSAADRMLLMMEGVLRYAGLDGFDQEIEWVDINEIIRSVVTDLETVIQKRNARIESGMFPKIPGYSILIYQLFYNLISNALKFSRSDIQPHIIIRQHNRELDNKVFAEFVIRDNGIGFESENAEKIFQTFSRLNSKEDYEGTGLGLALCKKIVLRHHGFISAVGEPGIGAVFTVLLPVKVDS